MNVDDRTEAKTPLKWPTRERAGSAGGGKKPICTTKDGAAVTVTAHYNNASVVNMIETGHYPMTGVVVYEEI